MTKQKAVLAYYLHNRFSASVEGTPEAIDMLKDLLIPNELVKGIVIYRRIKPKVLEKVWSINYTQLTALRRKETP